MKFSKISLKLIAFLFALQSQNAIAAVGDTDEICVSLQNVAVTGYLADAEVYDNNIGRVGGTALGTWEKGSDGKMHIVPSQWFEMVEGNDYRIPNWAEQPSPVTFNTKGGTKIRVSKTPDFATYTDFTASGNETKVYNLVPQTVYWYKVLNSAGKTIKSGLFKTTGDIRMVETERVLNVRDMGGWMLNSTSRMAYGKIFRGGRMDGMADKGCTLGAIDTPDKHRLKDILGIKANINLMDEKEFPTGMSNPLNVSDFLRKDFNHYMYLLTNTKYDNGIKSKDYTASIIAALEYVVDCLKNNKPVYINCSKGADRTGMLCLIIEAICGMKEADIVKDWELTSFNADLYCKYIDQEELTFYCKEGKKKAEMRSVFNYFYDHYYNSASYTKDIQGMVCYWLRQDVFKDKDRADTVIYALQDMLLCYHYKSPVIIRDGGKRSGKYKYLVSDESTVVTDGTDIKELSATNGNSVASDNGYHTNYIDCAGQTKLLVNAGYANIACFYDANKKFISGIADSNVTTQYGKDAVIFGYREYTIPEGAAYVRLNVKKNCDWTAVLMRDNKTTYEIENNL